MANSLRTKAMYSQVADLLRERIFRQELSPGDRVDELALAEELGVSRTPVREALKILDADGLVTLEPHRGCRVRELSQDDLAHLFPVMAVLEGLIARECVERIDQQAVDELFELHEQLEAAAADGDIDRYYEHNYRFHTRLQELCGNPYLQRVAAELRRILILARHRQLRTPGRLQASLGEHRQLMEAFRDRDPEAADACMKGHLLEQGRTLVGGGQRH
ncbi:MAG: GntR family transcriptional regulator [Halorhodospira halophila]|uniref:GntR family transcriptional regulator n=1 Tax=Halorhodospira TaxID=85108 RepID=UPI0019142EDF|nr:MULTISPECIES: GntR family transcriptional regulator [Halorhodospira]MBK5942641.1 hypothetical protein [Halorhodospira halophila]MCC3751458.1 GntR family transcriptional regulator [Halorhodospira halophila]MCG5529222.1 GntR family transcriptional regulator [Halorhodospira halophila]MCG5534004.1 GntR family transcriptional regulator [Halorhodospira sp. 9621]MCG5538269.1 GntR family transcriptional regulator [Halorhodospira sp. 9622]